MLICACALVLLSVMNAAGEKPGPLPVAGTPARHASAPGGEPPGLGVSRAAGIRGDLPPALKGDAGPDEPDSPALLSPADPLITPPPVMAPPAIIPPPPIIAQPVIVPQPVIPARRARVDAGGVLFQSFLFVSIEHSFRLTQKKTRREFSGPFFRNYTQSVRGIRGWNDGDSVFTNYIAHPMQGGVAGFIYVQNHPRDRYLTLGSPGYWRSRLAATAFSAAYSTQFEIGPISEATIGHVGKRPGTSGYVDLVMTPAGGFGMILLEDVVDKRIVRPWESRTNSLNRRRVYRTVLNPQRTFANMLRFRKPWHRDGRDIDGVWLARY
jgi:hypothetical protein